jgi:hypothetical protein
MRTLRILGLTTAGAIGAGLGCATLIGLSPAAEMSCTDPADQTALGQHQATFVADVLSCAVSSPGDLSVIAACIQAKDGISKPCADCSAVNGACASQRCSAMCLDGAESAPCQTCIAEQCNETLIACAGTPVYACVDPSDLTALDQHAATFETDVETCGIKYTNDANAVVACIQQQDGLSQPCALCYSQEGLCALAQCSACVNDPTSASCATCVGNACVPAFTLCSGIAPDAGP